MSIHPDDNEISAFWAWFATIADELGNDFSNQAMQDELGERLGRLGEIAWELGPGAEAEYALAISPDGDPGRLQLTQRIVALAPKLPRWEFHPARPARAESLKFFIETVRGAEIAIDARPWRYVLYKWPDKSFDIVLEQSNLPGASDDDRYTAAVVLLDAILGERRRLLRIKDVESVAALSGEQTKKSSPISELSEHLDSLC